MTTKAELLSLVELLNRTVGAPLETYQHDADGNLLRDADNRIIRNPETFQLDWAYGGVKLTRDAQSVDVSPRGSKRDTETWIRAFLAGIYHAQDHMGAKL